MANAYDVMSMAKRQGAEVNAVQKYDDYMERVRAEEARASKAGMFGKIGGGIGGSIASYLAPAALTALGIGTGGIGTMLLAGALGTGISRGGTELGDMLARQWGMGGKGGGKQFKDIGKMEGISGAYGQRYASKLGRAGREEMETYSNTIAQMHDIENTNRWLSSGMSGLSAAGKARSGAETLKGMPDADLGTRMKAGLEGDVGEGYKLGAKSTMGRFKPLPQYTPPTVSSQNLEAGLGNLWGGRSSKFGLDLEGQLGQQSQFGQSVFPQPSLFGDRNLGQLSIGAGYSPISDDPSAVYNKEMQSILELIQSMKG